MDSTKQKISTEARVNTSGPNTANHQALRDESISFESQFTENIRRSDNSIAKDFIQLNIKKESKLPITISELTEEKHLRKIIVFFKSQSFINLTNLKEFNLIIRKYLKDLDNLTNKLNRLREEIDKETSDYDPHGKLIMNWSLKTNKIRLDFERPKLNESKQYIAIPMNPKESSIVFTQNFANEPFNEIIKIRTKYTRQKKNSIKFDAQVWQAFNHSGISPSNYLKTLDCLERNHLNMKDFSEEVNKKELLELLRGNLINKISIKTNNKDTSLIRFRTNLSQQIETKITATASSLKIF